MIFRTGRCVPHSNQVLNNVALPISLSTASILLISLLILVRLNSRNGLLLVCMSFLLQLVAFTMATVECSRMLADLSKGIYYDTSVAPDYNVKFGAGLYFGAIGTILLFGSTLSLLIAICYKPVSMKLPSDPC
jgi:hypothetical protein